MKVTEGIKNYCFNIYEAVSTIATGMRITFKTAFLERKVTLQYPHHDIHEGRLKDAALFGDDRERPPFEVLLGAAQQEYRGPLNTRLPQRYRGLLGYSEPKCITCLMCAQNCPIDVIRVKGVKIEGRKARAPVTFRIDYSRCMFCGLCVEACPTDAIFFTREFEGATFEYRSLIRDFIGPELRRERLQQAEEAKKKKEAELGKTPK